MDYYKSIKTHPFREALLALRPVKIHCFSSSNKFHQYHPKRINISFFCDLATLSVFRSQVSIWKTTAYCFCLLLEIVQIININTPTDLPKGSNYSSFHTLASICLPPCQAKVSNLANKVQSQITTLENNLIST